jgi:hypothetical protein
VGTATTIMMMTITGILITLSTFRATDTIVHITETIVATTAHITETIVATIVVTTTKELKMSNVVKWLVEEKDSETGNVIYSQEFNSFDEASSVYRDLTRKRDDTMVSIEKSDKKLLLEG